MRRLLFELSKFDLKPAGSDACDRLTVNDFLEELDIIKTPAFVRLEASKWNPSGCFYIPGFDTDRFPISYKNHYKLLGFCDLRRAHLEKTQAIHTILLHISCLKVFNVAVHYRRTMEIKTELVFYSTVIMIAGRTAADWKHLFKLVTGGIPSTTRPAELRRDHSRDQVTIFTLPCCIYARLLIWITQLALRRLGFQNTQMTFHSENRTWFCSMRLSRHGNSCLGAILLAE
ncbi:hypothetical protein Y032_0331g2735 [Ancylostoma ceylanicum]|uniref:Uncharacterized protein n=1 Tax=Ancylostoma ceylanicum TaxID=53326 RepID=A0A016RZ86_9BILA|nr:hypothetical protein Y032_0331g2735 [Ancylostoma ceylanicum]